MKELKEFNEFEQGLKEFKDKYDNITYNLDDAKQNKQARSDKRSIGSLVARLDAKHKEVKAPLLDLTRKIDERRKLIKDDLRAVQLKISSQIDSHDKAIEEHTQMLQEKINVISFAADFEISNPISSDYELRISALKNIVIDESYEHRQENAENERVRMLDKLETLYSKAIQQEKDAKELQDLRDKQATQDIKDRDARIAKEAADNARIEAEKAAQDKIDFANAEAKRIEKENEQALLNVKLEKDKAIQAVKDSETQARLKIENDNRLAQEKTDIENAKIERKKATQKHRQKIHTGIKESLIKSGIDKVAAVKITQSIIDGEILNIKVEY